jgi:hypothetical protein
LLLLPAFDCCVTSHGIAGKKCSSVLSCIWGNPNQLVPFFSFVQVRHYAKKELSGYIRISVGKPEQTDAVVAALKQMA